MMMWLLQHGYVMRIHDKESNIYISWNTVEKKRSILHMRGVQYRSGLWRSGLVLTMQLWRMVSYYLNKFVSILTLY